MILSKQTKMKWNSANKRWFVSKGYIFTKMGNEFIVDIKDLNKGSNAIITIQCDKCKRTKDVRYKDYLNIVKNNHYYCNTCSKSIYSAPKRIENKIKANGSFYDWCIKNNRQDLLNRWDYNLNKCNPEDIYYNTNKYYFKCPKNIHDSELKSLKQLVKNGTKLSLCKACNSFAQWGIDNLGKDFLEKYWSDKNKNINPFQIGYCSLQKVWIKCQEKDYHDDYQITCADFNYGHRCPYCRHIRSNKVYKEDSLGTLYPKSLECWSVKNKKSPYEYAPHSGVKVYWKCINNEHEDYLRKISDEVNYNFRCPQCDYSKGENRIKTYFRHLGWIGYLYDTYKSMNISKQHATDYISQYKYSDLIGTGGGLLSYDFYLPKYNLLLEYQGEFHDGTAAVPKKLYVKQKEHDRRKRQYAKDHNIKLLEIWYWDY